MTTARELADELEQRGYRAEIVLPGPHDPDSQPDAVNVWFGSASRYPTDTVWAPTPLRPDMGMGAAFRAQAARRYRANRTRRRCHLDARGLGCGARVKLTWRGWLFLGAVAPTVGYFDPLWFGAR